jgi:hypothetical protein
MHLPNFTAEASLGDHHTQYTGRETRAPETEGVRPQQIGPDLLFGRPEIPEGVPIAPDDCFSLYENCAPCVLHRTTRFGIPVFEWRQGIREVRYCSDRFGGFRVIRGPCVEVPCSPFVARPFVP